MEFFGDGFDGGGCGRSDAVGLSFRVDDSRVRMIRFEAAKGSYTSKKNNVHMHDISKFLLHTSCVRVSPYIASVITY